MSRVGIFFLNANRVDSFIWHLRVRGMHKRHRNILGGGGVSNSDVARY